MSTTRIVAPVWMDKPPIKTVEHDLPSWYQEFQADSWSRFQDLPVASRSDESWRYADLKKSRFEVLAPAEPVSVPEGRSGHSMVGRYESRFSARFVYANGELVERDVSGIPRGVTCLPIEEAIARTGDRLRDYFDVDADRLGDEKFAALNGAATKYGLCLLVPRGVRVEDPILVQHFVHGDLAAVFPRTLVIAEANAEVSIVESFESVDDELPGLSIGIADFHADDGGLIQHCVVQDLNDHSKQVHLSTANSGRDARVRTIHLNLGAAWVRNESINRMTAPGADTHIYGANLCNGIQEYDQRTLQIHDAEHTTSDLLIKNALYDQSRAIFGGLIQVLPGAHYTDSYQSCRNLIGSEEAEVNAMPGLEIDADQVKCSHGATSGQISEEEIFYLRSRGITTDEAVRIVSCGFLTEAFRNVPDESLREWLGQLIEDKFDVI